MISNKVLKPSVIKVILVTRIYIYICICIAMCIYICINTYTYTDIMHKFSRII